MICYSCGTRISNNNNSSIINVCSNFCYHIASKYHRIDVSNLIIVPKVCAFCNIDISECEYSFYSNDQLYCSSKCSQKIE